MKSPNGKWLVAGGLAIVLLAAVALMAVSAWRASRDRTLTANRLRQIGLALNTYATDQPNRVRFTSAYPTNICDAQGKPLLSWRVRIAHLLSPDISLDGLRLDEPWDSAHNRQFIERMPESFASPGRPHDGRTVFLAPIGPDMLLGDPTLSTRARPDRSIGRQILVVEAEAERAIPWTCPDDLPYDRQSPLTGLRRRTDSYYGKKPYFLCAFGDARVDGVRWDLDPKDLRSLMEGPEHTEMD